MNLKRGTFYIIFLFLLVSFSLFGQTNSPNSDFEFGDLSGWSASNGVWDKVNHTLIFTNNTIITNRESIISDIYNDRNTCYELPSIPADGGKFVAKLGNNIKGAQAEQLRYSITVTPENALFIYKYAVVFEDPGHLDEEQPFFQVAVTNANGDIFDSLCGYNKIISGGTIPGFKTCVVHDDINNTKDTIVRWKPWTTVALDLTPYMGQSIQLEFTNADCSKGGHWGYSYIEARTGVVGINIKACKSDTVAYLTAPEGFSSYLWSTGESTREIAVQNPNNGDVFTCTMTSIPGCDVVLTATMEIETVNVTPADITICKGGYAEITANGADYYEWSNGLGIGSTKIVYPLETTEYSVKGISKAGCVDSGISKVTVLDAPQLTIEANTPCEGKDLTLNASPSTFVSYQWKGPNGFESTNQNPVISNSLFEMSGKYTISAINSNGCRMDKMLDVSILPIPNLLVTSNNVCEDETIQLKSFPTGLKSYNWTGPNGFTSNQQFTSITNANTTMQGEYTLLATNEFNCSNSTNISIQIFEKPTAEFSATSPCVGNEMIFTNNSSGATLWQWDFDNGLISKLQNPQGIFYNDSFERTVKLTVFNQNDCTDTISKKVVSHSLPVAKFSTNNACEGNDLELLDKSYATNDTIISWNWNLSQLGTSTIQNPKAAITNTDLIPVELTVSTKYCTNSIKNSIAPKPKPLVNSQIFAGCAPLQVQFNSQNEPNVFYNWNLGDGNDSPEANPEHYYLNTSNTSIEYKIKQTATSIYGCIDSAESFVTVHPEPFADFTLSKNKICSGESVTTTNTSNNGNQYYWDFGDGFTSSNTYETHIFINETNKIKYFPISLKITSSESCTDSIIKYISVYPFPSKAIELSDTAGCSPFIVELTTQSLASEYHWDLGDGTFEIGSNSIEHYYINETSSPIIYPISLKVSTSQGCEALFASHVTVFPSPKANFTIDSIIGCSPFAANIKNTSEGESKFTWNFNSQINAHPLENSFSHFFENKTSVQQSHKIEIHVENEFACKDMHSLSVNVFPEVLAQFNTIPIKGCSPLDVSFENTSIGADSYFWNYGDNTFSSNQNSRHTYVNLSKTTQQYGVQLIAISAYNCRDTSEITTIDVYPQPLAKFNTSTISGCSPLEVEITDNSEGATNYNWNYGNEKISSTLESKQLYKNLTSEILIFSITLEAINEYNCVDTAIQPITVFPEIIPDFLPETIGCSPLPVTFTNNTLHADMYVWNFGDGKKSTVDNPKNTFINSSLHDTIFKVTLEASSHLGCKASTSKNIQVFATPNPTFIPSASSIRIPVTQVDFSNQTIGNWNYEWDFGNNNYSYDQHPEGQNYTSPGIYPVILKATSSYCEDTVIHFIHVTGDSIIADYDSSAEGCSPLRVNFTNKSLFATEYLWNFSDGETSTEQNPTHVFTSPGTYVIELTARNGNLVDVSRAHTVTVFENPKAQFEVAPNHVVLPNAEIITYNQSRNIEKSTWYFGDGTIREAFQPTHTYLEEGQYDIALTVESRDGCTDSILLPKAVTVLLDCGLKFPNAFTPNGGENNGFYDVTTPEITNDIFHPISLNIIDYKLQIFNRWGEIVFESTQIEQGWNGYYKGSLSKSDVFVWKCEATCLGGKNIELVGNVTLLR